MTPPRKPAAPAPARRDADRARPVGLFVLGMHRSGTSLLTRVLNLLGCELPGDLLGANRSNPTGHWESLRAIEINDTLLRQLGRGWDDPRELPVDWLLRPETEVAREQVRAFLDSEFAGKPLWLLKEPRLCRLGPLWLDVARSMGVDARVIVPLRHPSEVAYSLSRRDGIDPGRGFALWWQHLHEAARASGDLPRTLASFEGMLADWRKETARIADALGLAWSVAADAIAAEVAQFIDPGLLHAQANDRRQALTQRLPPPAALRVLYGHLADAPGDGFASIEAVARDIDAGATLFAPVLEDLSQRAARSDERAVATQQLLATQLGTDGGWLLGREHAEQLLAESRRLVERLDEAGPLAIELVRLVEALRAEVRRGEANMLEATGGAHLRLDNLAPLLSELVQQLEAQRNEQQRHAAEMLEHGHGLAGRLEAQGPIVAELIQQVEAQRNQLQQEATAGAERVHLLAATLSAQGPVLAEVVAQFEAQRAGLASTLGAADDRHERLVAMLREHVQALSTKFEEATSERLEASRESLAQLAALVEQVRAENAALATTNARLEQAQAVLASQHARATSDLADALKAHDALASAQRDALVDRAREQAAEQAAREAWSGAHERAIAALELRHATLAEEQRTRYSALAEAHEARARELDVLRAQREVLEHGARAQAARLVDLEAELAARAQRVQGLERDVARTEAGWAAAANDLEQSRYEREELARDVARRHAELAALHDSRSWRITAPLRAPRELVNAWRRREAAAAAAPVALPGPGIAARAYRALPMPWTLKLAAKSVLFRVFAPFLRDTDAYRRWEMQRAHDRSARERRDYQALPGAPATTHMVANAPSSAASVYVPIAEAPVDAASLRAKAIAFYLPQFHPIPENDAWWGRGFTEWTNVTKALPQFEGHEQPHLPGELGFYDLRVPDVMHRQIELAKLYGLHGFCFHYYWFDGRRILERPLDQFLGNDAFDFPFCICWANENWTRRWDGHDSDVLLGQSHSPESDLRFIRDVEPILRDPRYIRVDGKPLLVVYRPSLLPDCAATVARWREYCRASGLGEIELAMVQFDALDPRPFGFDVALEFPPHKVARDLPSINATLPALNPAFKGYVVDYQVVAERSRQWPVPEFDMIRGVFPGWDNEARKPQQGYLFAHSTPDRYRDWLSSMVDYAQAHPVAGESLVFINAWNEWAEGAHLEPDRRHGYAYLQATRDALTGPVLPARASLPSPVASERPARIVVVSHDAHPHGAQYLALNLCRELATQGWGVDAVLLGEGVLEAEFARVADVHRLDGGGSGPAAHALAQRLRAGGAERAIANTAVSGLFVPVLVRAGLRVVSLVHELPGVLAEYKLDEHARQIAAHAIRVAFAARPVLEGFESLAPLPPGKALVRPQGLYKRNRFQSANERAQARADVRRQLGVPADARLVLGVGYADLRKGVDLFVQIGELLVRRDPRVHLVWLGHFDLALEPRLRAQVQATGLAGHFHFPGRQTDTDPFYAAADVYALTSREDPFPSVVMEAYDVHVPVVGFASAGGFEALLRRGGGRLAPAFEVQAFAAECAALLDDDALRVRLGDEGKAIVAAEFDFGDYVRALVAAADGADATPAPAAPTVSVVVPNYNYARFMAARLGSIEAQTIRPDEIIVLDDASTDDSLAVLDELAPRIGARVVANAVNSGSVCRQWLRGVREASGDLVWIAEADDLSDPGFLAAVLPAFADPGVVMSYCQSRQVGAEAELLSPDYLDYVSDFGRARWTRPFVSSLAEELEHGLAVKNTIPNVSAVVFRRQALLEVLERHLDDIASFRIAGDWVTYLRLLEHGALAFTPEAHNLHRRHAAGVTIGTDHRPHMAEIERVQDDVAALMPLSEATRRAVAGYREFLLGYFGLDRRGEHA